MPQYSQGDIVRDYFTLQDVDGVNITGQTMAVESTISPDDEDFTLTITEIGLGIYRVEFVASLVGTYYYRISSTTLSPPHVFEETFVVGPATLYGAAIGTTAYGHTLADLIRDLAIEMGDFLEIEATDDGAVDGTSWPDQLRLATIPAGAFKGANLITIYPENSLNYLSETRVEDSSEDSRTLILQPALPAPVLDGDKAWLVNLNSEGHWFQQYTNAINSVLRIAGDYHSVPVDYTYPDLFSIDDPEIPTPLHLTKIYAVQAYDTEGNRYTIPFNDQNSSTMGGWYYDFASGRIIVGDTWNWIDAHSIRLLGYGRPAPLVNMDDFTTVPSSWIVERAAAKLHRGTGDQRKLAPSSMEDNLAMTDLLTILTPEHPNTIRIR